ncbi:unnamed protein product [Brassica napus]|uniref:(rape) hypothetical protein n=1 Tax=Brassica napus TaxID=3708 RepID=A0A816ITE3_BRANA|nr:unnamed protein product [Brassica napus]
MSVNGNREPFEWEKTNKRLKEVFVDGRLLILSTTRVVNHNRPFLHIKDPNIILSQSAVPGLGLGFIDDGKIC